MVMNTQTTLLAAALLALGVACQETTKEPIFTYPPDGSKYTYHRLDTVIVNYTVFDDTAELYTFCEPGRGRLINQQPVPGFNGSVPILLNFASDTPCWFDLRTGPDGINNKSSASFNILIDERRTGPQTFGVDTDAPTQSTPTQSTSTSSATSSTATSSETSSPPPEGESGGLKGGALYAVAFCSGIFGAILILSSVHIWGWWDNRRDNKKLAAANAKRAALRLRQEERLRNARNALKSNNGGNGGNEGGGSEGSGVRDHGGGAGTQWLDLDLWRRGVKGEPGKARDEPDVARAV